MVGVLPGLQAPGWLGAGRVLVGVLARHWLGHWPGAGWGPRQALVEVPGRCWLGSWVGAGWGSGRVLAGVLAGHWLVVVSLP